MSDTQNYDTKNLDVLRRDLKELRNRAKEEGVIRSDVPEQPKVNAGGGAARRFAAMRRGDAGENADGAEKGKQLATRILAMLRRGNDDDSPNIPGTNFTEDGVKRLMTQLTEPQKGRRATSPLIQKLHKFLTTPTGGGKTIAGASLERIRMLANLLPQVEKHGWEQVRAHLAKRKENRAAEAEAEEVAEAPPPAAARQRRGGRRTAS